MNTDELCMALMRADTEDEVVDLLSRTGYWADENSWRYLGDNENNYGSIGNQQSEAVTALTEKLINGVDARLMNDCLVAGIEPTSSNAPDDIRSAVAMFFEDHARKLPDDAGTIALWPDSKMTAEAEKLTLTATGFGPKTGSGRLCLTISDAGEGQTPDDFPDTFLSLQKSNKLRVPFVQGKFNMGATGALQFCSPTHRLQLIVSRRNPALVSGQGRDAEWGFTVVRRAAPSHGARSSVFTYLAPVGRKAGRDGAVLSFAAEAWPIFPRADKSGRDAYERDAEYGSLVKLYEYNLDGSKSNIVMSGGGLLTRVDFALPELALPIRLYECRTTYRGHSGSFATNVLGVVARLERDRSDKLEEGFPIGHVLRLEGREVRIRVYALKESAREYRSGKSAIVFSINGQTHATKSADFFRRTKAVGMSQLADSLIVVVDCSDIDGQLREDMFLNSRDRLRTTPMTRQMESGLERFLKNDPTLRELKNRRRAEEIKERLDEARPLADALSNLVQQTPGLSRLLSGGPAIPSPFPRAGTGRGHGKSRFEGRRFPTFFRFRNKTDGEGLQRVAHLGSAVRLKFETDAQDDYFHRDSERGAFEVDIFDVVEGNWKPLDELSLTGPTSGIAGLSFDLPATASIGETVRVRIRVTDPSRLDSFDLEAVLTIAAAAQRQHGTTGRDKTRNAGEDTGDEASNLALPNIIPVSQPDWHIHDFDELSALKVVGQGESESGQEVFDFYVNYDNKHLLAAQKDPSRDAEALRGQFVYSLVLYSMAMLIEEKAKGQDPAGAQPYDDLETLIRFVSRRLAPFVLPTLEAMGALVE